MPLEHGTDLAAGVPRRRVLVCMTDFREDCVLVGCASEVHADGPARIVESGDLDAIRVFPDTVSMCCIPGLETRESWRVT